ncbi:hypothetical protein DFR86_09970 [Acidianus sulfidivorans JP7]|uniref:YncE family protein n=1 Tax=Acidianus sulfidivorans JP7 TaxID=619593 RepID=A0A2U9IPA1_9CREN|nr:hypothetical protein [Acidianus sulfidivorans]AWR97835.1 hypothetical protein DFR86_09970 [Acidianus sulfidivorans JP7]
MLKFVFLVVLAISLIPVGNSPSGIIYSHNNIYVANYNSSSVSVIDPSSDSVIGVIHVGLNPVSIVCANGYVFVSDAGSDEVSIIKGGAVVKNVSLSASPYSLTFDNNTNEVFVSEPDVYSIVAISVNNLSIVRSFSIGFSPGSIVYDPSNNELYVAQLPIGEVGNVYVLNPNNGVIVNSYSIGGYPANLAYFNGNVFVASWYNNKVFIINSTGVYNFDAGVAPFGIVYDPNDGYLYVSDVATNSVLAMTLSGHIVDNISAGMRPSYMVFADGKIFVSSALSNAVYVIPQVPPPSLPLSIYLLIIGSIAVIGVVGFIVVRNQMKSINNNKKTKK